MPILDHFCLWESPTKCVSVIQAQRVYTDSLDKWVYRAPEICWQISEKLKPSKKLILYVPTLQPSSLNQFVYIVYIWVKNIEPVKVIFRYDLEICITSTAHFQNIPLNKKCTDDRIRCLCSLKRLHQYTPAISFSNSQHKFITSIIFNVPWQPSLKP